jgi:hypothetical protein
VSALESFALIISACCSRIAASRFATSASFWAIFCSYPCRDKDSTNPLSTKNISTPCDLLDQCASVRPLHLHGASWPLGGHEAEGGLGRIPAAFSRDIDTAEQQFWRSLDLSGITVYDIGAFQGLLTLFFASRAKRVVCFEPNTQNYKRLMENLVLNPVNKLFTFTRFPNYQWKSIRSSNAN